ncbi:glycosyltransferase family 39 protein [Ramlibacter monticola]|uniref:Glycosyltransferase family 39 protein n=1 Tax=Ramlibacter monticola TaxID=1926872 RepID=A0A937CS27_9BURK|nr:glycosyltransferase family 39 protein [Ramlibacter monticola]MBL0391275.1 glycosyltransferase family 39 protein [Ramlibacter monticola]
MADPAAADARWPGWAAVPALRRVAFALLLALPLLWQLGGTPLFDVDEGAFSEATREMLASGDWGHTTLNGADRFDKPILIYWLQAASAAAFGFGEFALRLPSALACWAMALALAAFAARRWGERAGLLAGAMTVTSIGWQMIGRGATADGVLNLLLVLATLDAWRFLDTGRKAPLRRAFAWVGLGLLVKGPIALLVPGAAVLVWCAASRRWAPLRLALADLPGWALLLALAAPWYAYALHRHGMAFVEGFLLRHNVERFTGTIGGHAGSSLYYLVVLPLLALPWTPLLAGVLRRWRAAWADPLGRFLLGWSAFVLLFFSFASTKLPHYVLYGYAPLVLLMARALAEGSKRLHRLAAAGLVLGALLVAALPWLVLHFAPAVRDPFYRALLSGVPAPSWQPVAGLSAVLALLLAWKTGAPALRLAGAAGALALFIAGATLPWFGEALQGPVRRAAAAAASHPGTVAQWQVHLPSFAVYLARVSPKRDPLPEDMVLTRADRVPPGEPRARLYEERGVVLLGPRR